MVSRERPPPSPGRRPRSIRVVLRRAPARGGHSPGLAFHPWLPQPHVGHDAHRAGAHRPRHHRCRAPEAAAPIPHRGAALRWRQRCGKVANREVDFLGHVATLEVNSGGLPTRGRRGHLPERGGRTFLQARLPRRRQPTRSERSKLRGGRRPAFPRRACSQGHRPPQALPARCHSHR